MNWKDILTATAMGAASVGLVACGGAVDDGADRNIEKTPDGQKKNVDLEGKGDAWDWLNDPSRFQADLTYEYSELADEEEGYTENEVWPATYWPTYKDNLNQRWQGDDTLSPAEKYDKAFNGWTPEVGFDSFMDLQPFDTDTCQWDDEYYEQLGPAAIAESRDGNWKAHNGIDDDGDGVPDSEECGYGSDADYDGVETWFGLCHAWAPAAILEKEPKNPVTVEDPNGEEVTFEVSDIKALIIEKYDRSESYMIGGRCNANDVERDETGRIPDDECRDVNAGSFHVIMTNFLGLEGRPIVEDRVYDYEVWNQPVIGYKINRQEEISLEEVQSLLNTADEEDEDSTPETEEERTQVLRGANELTEEQLINNVGLRAEKASTIIEYRNLNGDFEDISTLEDEVGSRTLSRLLDFAFDQGWLEEQPEVYSYNENAESFVEVEMTTEYVTESHPSTEPLADRIDQYTRTDDYHYILELDGDGNIIGGEWVGRSIENHPDFLWLPTGPGGGNDNIDIEKARELIERSRSSSPDDGDSGSGDVLSFESTETMEIPDNDYEGATSEIEVDAEGQVDSLTLSVDIEHSYKGDVAILLYKDGTRSIVYKGWETEQPWEDDVQLTNETVEGFEGLDLAGTWKLRVVDVMSPDPGTLNSWSLEAQVAN